MRRKTKGSRRSAWHYMAILLAVSLVPVLLAATSQFTGNVGTDYSGLIFFDAPPGEGGET
ncbi:MAG: hypothetical protein A3J97_06995 [Spirochaetes bacterium RIFOXYC1_FULL_54_7]|nr:MAG: hypothetical protein A3J97_06995 [Spirochaetes bacterium RIFOXYC1_FULL_54_7]